MPTSVAGQPLRIFRWKLRRLERFMAAVFALMGLGFPLALISRQSWEGSPADYGDLVVLSLIPLGLILVVIAFFRTITALFPLRLYETGLNGSAIVGPGRIVTWDEMLSAEFVRSRGMDFVYVYTPNSTWPFGVPLELDDFTTFRHMVAEYAGPKNPLVKALEHADQENTGKVWYRVPPDDEEPDGH